MLDSTTRRHWLFSALAGTFAAGTMATATGCGSILFPERVGQPRGGPIDWRVVALDGVGLVFFFVPGIIAFAVDFYNGTIFLPSHSSLTDHGPATAESLAQLALPAGPDRRERVEQIVTAHAGQTVLLAPGSYHTEPLERIEHFWTALRNTAGLPDTADLRAPA